MEAIEDWARSTEGGAARPDWLLPVDAAFATLPRLDLDDAASLHLRQGRPLALDLPGGSPRARVYDPGGRFLGLVEPAPGRGLRVVRLFVHGADASDARTA